MKLFKKLTVLSILVFQFGCQKAWLDKRSDKSMFVPSTLTDFQNILDNTEVFSGQNTPWVTVNTSDDFYITSDGWKGLGIEGKNAYIWNFSNDETLDYWSIPYKQVFYANVVLDGLTSMQTDKSSGLWNNLKGTALFYRSFAFYTLAQIFTKPYVVGMPGTDLGIPLRLGADVDAKYPRGTVKEVYDQIISDLILSVELLPDNSDYKTRPTKNAASALLARVNLAIGSYRDAEKYADAALKIKNVLLDYDVIDATPTRSFPLALPNSNEEIIWYASMYSAFIRSSFTYADTTLYDSYDNFDKRKTLFFLNKGGKNANFKGSYTGDVLYFTGLATDELYLIRAECLARRGETILAMNDLNGLLIKRWTKDKFNPIQVNSSDDALQVILKERRKELIGRGTRWADLRRFNQDDKFSITQIRKLDGVLYMLVPEDVSKYHFKIPQDEVSQFGFEQN